MAKIQQLDQQTINAIAAGEVVERPASVVKELVENAIDAAADRIDIAIKHGGIAEIIIQDNGNGIVAGELELALVKHATSKLKVLEDLHNLSSMGFRGEALAAIAAVSKLTLISKPEEQEHAYFVEQHAGKTVKKGQIAANKGTQVIVRELFYNVPARLKFLKKEVSEAQAISRIVTELALANPGIAFTLVCNDKLLLQTPGNNDLLSVIHALFGKDIADNLLPITADYNYTVQLTGYIGKATLSKKSRRYEFFFVNGRTFQSTVVLKALEDALRDFLMSNQFPTAFLFLTLPTNLLDVNVHPRKLEVRFWNDNEVYKSVYHQVKGAVFNFLAATRAALVNSSVQQAVLGNDAARQVTAGASSASEDDRQTAANLPSAMSQPLEGELTLAKNELDSSQAMVFTVKHETALTVKQEALAPQNELVQAPKQQAPKQQAPKFDEAYLNRFKNAKLYNLQSAASEQVSLRLNEQAESGLHIHESEKADLELNKHANDYEQANGNLRWQESENSYHASNNEYKDNTSLSLTDRLAKPELKQVDTAELAAQLTLNSVSDLQNSLFKHCSWEVELLQRLKDATYLGQIMSTYLLFADAKSLMVLDQHALHERILYEKFCRRYNLLNILSGEKVRIAANVAAQSSANLQETPLAEALYETLLVPYEFSLEATDSLLLQSNLAAAEILGYKITELGKQQFALHEIPKQRRKKTMALLIEELLLTLAAEELTSSADLAKERQLKHFLATRACRSAIMAGDFLAPEMVPLLLKELFTCINPYQCPHGRPICLDLTQVNFEKAFRRRL